MTPGTRKLTLTTHIIVSVGWIGAVLAYLALVLAAMSDQHERVLRAAWFAFGLIGWYVIVPLAVAALVSGFCVALGSPWGLFRHYWVVTSLALTVAAIAVLLGHMWTVASFARLAAEGSHADIGRLRAALRGELLHAGLGLLVLLAVAAINVYKPQGMTAYGRKAVPLAPRPSTGPEIRADAGARAAIEWPRWVHAVWIHALALVLLFALGHFATGGFSRP